MHKMVQYAITVNIILALAFVYGNFSLWSFVNAEYPLLIASHWSPFLITAPHYYYSNGDLSIATTLFLAFNTPFWIFWIMLAVNLGFIILLGRNKEAKQNTT